MDSDITCFLMQIYPRAAHAPDRAAAYQQISLFYRGVRRNFPPDKNIWAKFYNTDKGAYLHRKLREYLATRQNQLCCYCQDKIYHHINSNIEHILPIKHYPYFAFSFDNLALSCATCNALKSADDWFKLASVKQSYRRNKFDCFHPRYHSYHEHIEMIRIGTNKVDVRVFIGKTNEGKVICKNLLGKVSNFFLKEKTCPEISKAITSLENYISNNPDAASLALEQITKVLYSKI